MSHRRPIPPFQEEYIEGVSDQGLDWLNLVRTYAIDLHIETFTLDPASLAAATTRQETVTINGLKTDDIVLAVIKPTYTANYIISGSHNISAANTLKITVFNPHASSAADPSSETYTLIYIKNSKA